MELRADREGPDAFGRFARVIRSGDDRALADLGEGLFVTRPAQAAAHLELLAQLEGRVAEDRILLVCCGQADDRERLEAVVDFAVPVERAGALRISIPFPVKKTAPHPFE